MKKILILGLILAFYSLSTFAIEVTVNRTNCIFTTVQCDALDANVKSAVENELPDVSISNYANGIANSNSFSQAGMSSDYSDRFDTALIKFAAGVAVQGDLGELQEDLLQAEGFSAGAAVTVGLNLNVLDSEFLFGFIELSKLDTFISIGAFDQNQSFDQGNLDAKVKSLSLMARYQIVDPVDIAPGYLLYWGGVSLHTGIQYANFQATLTSAIEDQTVDVGGDTADITGAMASINIDTTTITVPIEVSTSLRTIWALTLFGGAGFDFVSGSSDVSLNASGSAQNGANYSADILADDDASGDADLTNFRAFAGAQLNLPYLRLYGQLNKGLGSDLIGGNVGLKVLW